MQGSASTSLSTAQSRKAAAEQERRIGMEPIPSRLDLYLTPSQLESLTTMEYFGWCLAFVRRSDLNNIIPVIKNIKKMEFAVLDLCGDIIRNPQINIRH